jgi:hypothetical protein
VCWFASSGSCIQNPPCLSCRILPKTAKEKKKEEKKPRAAFRLVACPAGLSSPAQQRGTDEQCERPQTLPINQTQSTQHKPNKPITST